MLENALLITIAVVVIDGGSETSSEEIPVQVELPIGDKNEICGDIGSDRSLLGLHNG